MRHHAWPMRPWLYKQGCLHHIPDIPEEATHADSKQQACPPANHLRLSFNVSGTRGTLPTDSLTPDSSQQCRMCSSNCLGVAHPLGAPGVHHDGVQGTMLCSMHSSWSEESQPYAAVAAAWECIQGITTTAEVAGENAQAQLHGKPAIMVDWLPTCAMITALHGMGCTALKQCSIQEECCDGGPCRSTMHPASERLG